MDPASGLTWVLCIIFLTLVMRTLTIPLFVKQIKAMRGMTAMQGDMAKLQEKYKGKKDQLSRQAMAQEQMEMYRKHGTNPFDADLLRSVPGADGRSHRGAEQPGRAHATG